MANFLMPQHNLDIRELNLHDVLADFLLTKNSPQTVRSYRADLTPFLQALNLYFLGDLADTPFHQVVEKTLVFIRSYEKIDEHLNKVKNPTTVNRKAYAISSFFQYLMSVYNYPKNPIRNFTPHKTHHKSTTVSLSRAEALDILKALQGKHRQSERDFRNYLIIVFLSIFALRRQELISLTWDAINVQQASMNVYQKGGTYKLLPIPANIMQLLQAFKTAYPSDVPYIFKPTRNNTTKTLEKPLTTSYIYQLVEKIAQAEVPDKKITPHSFRKTFIELAIANKEDFVSITNSTGHAHINMIGYYCTSDTLKHNAIHGMARIL